MKENKIAGIYKITNTITGDFYIGSSKNIKKRWHKHRSPSGQKQLPNSKLYKATATILYQSQVMKKHTNY